MDRYALTKLRHREPRRDRGRDGARRGRVLRALRPSSCRTRPISNSCGAGLPRELQVKNISYHPESDSIPRFEAAPEVKQRVEQILRTHGQRVEAFLRRSTPDFVPGWTLGTTSFRSIEEQGRNLEAALEQRARAHRRRRLRRDQRRADPAVLREHPSDVATAFGAPRAASTR